MMEEIEIEKKFLKIVKNLPRFNQNIENKLYRVGGCVRDSFLKLPSKDIDYLVTNVSFNDLKSGLEKIYGDNVISTNVGDSMNVIKVAIGDGEPFDFAIPRKDIYGMTGNHTDLNVIGDPSMSVEEDLSRRDCTMNAIALDIESGEYIDPFNGIKDIRDGLIVAVGDPDIRFKEDALRILRMIQFSCRFSFTIEHNTWNSIKKNKELLKNITGERIAKELEKAFTKSYFGNNYILLCLLTVSGIGKLLFGSFDEDNKFKSTRDIVINYMLLFSKCGEFEFLNLSNEIVDSIKLLRRFLSTTDWFNVLYKNNRYYDNLKKTLCLKYPEYTNIFDILDKKVFSPNELKISSEELMKLGYVGEELGKIKKELCRLIYEDVLNNDAEEMWNYVKNLKY